MPIRPILKLGDPRLHEVSTPVTDAERPDMQPIAQDLFDTMAAFVAERGWGRAIAAPQIGSSSA